MKLIQQASCAYYLDVRKQLEFAFLLLGEPQALGLPGEQTGHYPSLLFDHAEATSSNSSMNLLYKELQDLRIIVHWLCNPLRNPIMKHVVRVISTLKSWYDSTLRIPETANPSRNQVYQRPSLKLEENKPFQTMTSVWLQSIIGRSIDLWPCKRYEKRSKAAANNAGQIPAREAKFIKAVKKSQIFDHCHP